MDSTIWAALIGAVALIAGILVTRLLERPTPHPGQRKVTVHRVREPDDPILLSALALLENRIKDSERDSREDIVRWIREVNEETQRGVCRLEDYFLVANVGASIGGFAYLQFYPQAGYAFFSYLVINKKVREARLCKVSSVLIEEIHKALLRSGKCKGILIEVEEPDVLEGNDRLEAAARIEVFKARARAWCWLKSIRIRYVQPKLNLSDVDAKEVRLRLMYAPLRANNEPNLLLKQDVAELLAFLADDVYGDHFENRAELDIAYRKYLQTWKTSILRPLSDTISLD